MPKKLEKIKWQCQICFTNYEFSKNRKKKKCKICKKYLEVGYKESEIFRRIIEDKDVYKKTILYNAKEKNPTFRRFWEERKYNKDKIDFELKKRNKGSIEYWIDRGYSKEESIKKVEDYFNHSVRERSQYWRLKGFSNKNSIKYAKKASKNRGLFIKNNYKHENNILRPEFWIKRGYSEEGAEQQIKNEQKRRLWLFTK